jgi:hypothetical protein
MQPSWTSSLAATETKRSDRKNAPASSRRRRLGRPLPTAAASPLPFGSLPSCRRRSRGSGKAGFPPPPPARKATAGLLWPPRASPRPSAAAAPPAVVPPSRAGAAGPWPDPATPVPDLSPCGGLRLGRSSSPPSPTKA